MASGDWFCHYICHVYTKYVPYSFRSVVGSYGIVAKFKRHYYLFVQLQVRK
jgi:hypothetical protein